MFPRWKSKRNSWKSLRAATSKYVSIITLTNRLYPNTLINDGIQLISDSRRQRPLHRVQRQPDSGDKVRRTTQIHIQSLPTESTLVPREGEGSSTGSRGEDDVHARAKGGQGRPLAAAALCAEHRATGD